MNIIEKIESYLGEAKKTEKIACLECDEVSTQKAWKKAGGFCPKCKKSSRGVAEAISFDTNKYMASHGKKPKGEGSWAFQVNGKEVWVKGMKSYTDAKKQMAKDYKNDKNVFSITVLP